MILEAIKTNKCVPDVCTSLLPCPNESLISFPCSIRFLWDSCPCLWPSDLQCTVKSRREEMLFQSWSKDGQWAWCYLHSITILPLIWKNRTYFPPQELSATTTLQCHDLPFINPTHFHMEDIPSKIQQDPHIPALEELASPHTSSSLFLGIQFWKGSF